MAGDSGITRDSQNMGLRAVESAGQFQMRGAENAAQQIASLPAGFLAAQKQARDQQAQDMVLASEMADAQMRRQEVAQKMAMVTALRDLEMQGLAKKNAQMDLEFKRTQLETAMMEAENRGEISGTDVARMMASSPEAVFGENVLSIKPTASGRFTMESVRDPEKAKALSEQQQRTRSTRDFMPQASVEEVQTYRSELSSLYRFVNDPMVDPDDPRVVAAMDRIAEIDQALAILLPGYKPRKPSAAVPAPVPRQQPKSSYVDQVRAEGKRLGWPPEKIEQFLRENPEGGK